MSVFSDLKRGVMVCRECEGTCPLNTMNYDDVMHLKGCSRRKMVDMFEVFPVIQGLARNENQCLLSPGFLTSMKVSRTCPAWRKAMGGLIKPERGSAVCGDQAGECYNMYYQKHEEIILEAMEFMEV